MEVTQANTTVKNSIEVDKNVHRIIGIAVTADKEDLAYHRGSQKILIDEEEFKPEGSETKKIMCGLNVPPNLRLYRFRKPVDPGNRKVEFAYTDKDNVYAPFDTYKVRLTIYSIIKDGE